MPKLKFIVYNNKNDEILCFAVTSKMLLQKAQLSQNLLLELKINTGQIKEIVHNLFRSLNILRFF